MNKKFFDYTVSSVVLLVVVSIFIYHNNDFFKLKKHNENVDSLIAVESVAPIDTTIVIKFDSVINDLEKEKCELEKRKKILIENKKRIQDSILSIEKLKQKQEMLKLKERYENQLDNIPNYRGGDIDTLKVEVK